MLSNMRGIASILPEEGEFQPLTQVWLAEVVGDVGDDDIALRVER